MNISLKNALYVVVIVAIAGTIAYVPLHVSAVAVDEETFVYSFDTTLRMGMRNNADVSALQQALTFEGFYTGKIDGNFGTGTRRGVIRFQAKYGIRTSGLVGTITRAKLNELYGPDTSSSGEEISGLPGGCTSITGYSTTTGQSCASTTTTTFPAGCMSTVGYSPTTGILCSSTIMTGTLCPNGNTQASNCATASTSGTTTTPSPVLVLESPRDKSSKLQARGKIHIGVIEFTPQSVVYGRTYYAYLKKTFSCFAKASELGYYFVHQSNPSINSSDCYDIKNVYSFLDIFNNQSKTIAKNVVYPSYSLDEKNVTENLQSVYYIKDWYEKEAAKYGINDLSFTIDIKGPYVLVTDPPPADRWGTEGICNSNLKQFFMNEGKKNGIDERNYDVTSYVYLSDWQLSNRTYQGFTSCADSLSRQTFSSVPTFTYPEEADSVVVLAHEIGHVFGASDYYTSPCDVNQELQSCVKEPWGIPEPYKVPKYPQTAGCLMAQTIQKGEPATNDSRPLSNLDLAVMCDAAAKEIGWK